MHIYCVMDFDTDSRLFTVVAPNRKRALELLAQRYAASGILLHHIDSDIIVARDELNRQTDIVVHDLGEFKEGVF